MANELAYAGWDKFNRELKWAQGPVDEKSLSVALCCEQKHKGKEKDALTFYLLLSASKTCKRFYLHS